MTAKAMAKNKKAKTKKPRTRENARRQSSGQDREKRLDRELAESFPASDPPSVTQPGSIPGSPERNIPSGEQRQ
ncbi:MAG: hypothetical protein ACT4O2_01040 [Beijerinckiaceae bacterium]